MSTTPAKTLTLLTQEIQQKTQDFESVDGNEVLRQDLIGLARSLISQLLTPREKLAHLAYFDFALYPVIRVLVDLGIFRELDAASQPVSVKRLAEESGADEQLLRRLLKHVAVANFVDETSPDTYVANEMTRCLASPGGQGVILDIWSASKCYSSFPEYFKSIGYANPLDKNNSAWYHRHNQHYFEYVFAPGHEREKQAFHDHMSFKAFGMKWYDIPDLVDTIFGSAANLSHDQTLIVDVGGSTGHDLLDFVNAQPRLPGRKILQDLPKTIESVDKARLRSHGIEAMAYDFFTPQPIESAKVYYLKMVLHDWPAEQCQHILANLRNAMKPGYSRILLVELVIPETNARWFESSLDILMMAVHGAQERREVEWRDLVEKVDGLRVKKIWFSESVAESVIEIERIE